MRTVFPLSKNIPLEFSAEKNVAWKARLGDGVGSAIVKDGVVFATGMAGDMKVALHAFDAATGAVKWRWELKPARCHASHRRTVMPPQSCY